MHSAPCHPHFANFNPPHPNPPPLIVGKFSISALEMASLVPKPSPIHHALVVAVIQNKGGGAKWALILRV